MSSTSSKIIELFGNPNIDRDFAIRIDSTELTCLCPLTSQPEFVDIDIKYISDNYCLELKALKNYFWSYQNEDAIHEAINNEILDDLVDIMSPRFIRLKMIFNISGGVSTNVDCEHRKEGWAPKEEVRL